jgi:hypothetical protein
MAYKIKNKKEKRLLEGYHKVKPLYPINKDKSRFAYAIYVKNKKIKGEYKFEGVNIYNKEFIYKRIK